MQTSIKEWAVSYKRTAFAGALVALAILGDSFLYAALPVHYREAGVSLIMVGWLLSLNRWVRLFTNTVAGWLGSCLGWNTVFTAALWLTVITTFGYGRTGSVPILLLLRGLWGLCWSLLRLGGQAAVLAESAPGQRASHMGLFTGMYRLGSLAGMVVGGYLADIVGFKMAALWLSVATVLGAIIGSLPPAANGQWGAPAKEEGVNRDLLRAATGWIPEGHEEWVVCICAASLYFVTSGIVTSTVGLLVTTRLGDRIALNCWVLGAGVLSGLLLSTRWVIDFLLGPLLGWCTDRWGRSLALVAGYLTIVMMLFVLSSARGLLVIVLSLVVLFCSGTACAVALDGWAGDIAGRTPGRFLPVYATWIDAGAAVGPLMGYYLSETCSLSYGYIASAGLILIGGVICWALSCAAQRRG
jgi:MFS family permease